MGILKNKKNKKNGTSFAQKEQTMFERIVFDNLETDSDQQLITLADQLVDGCPLIINLELLDIDQANKVMAFLSGVTYAVKGEIVNVKDKVFLFAKKDVYEDGTIEEFLKEIVE